MTRERHPLLEVYAIASGGDMDAYAWLLVFHGWAHRIDDFVDEPDHFAPEAVDLCAMGVVLTSSRFYQRHVEALAPLLGIVAEQYHASLAAKGPLADALRIAGNQVVLMVAYLKGGAALVRNVSQRLWPIVEQTQFAQPSTTPSLESKG